MSKRYRAAGKREKRLLLQKLCDSSEHHKKHAIRLLNAIPKKKKRQVKTGRLNVYPENIFIEPLKRIWLLNDQLCDKYKRSLSGNFVWSLTMTDICSGWTELRAV